ncbi:fungal specific transcription factor domain-containing protein [Sarocladium implicatum]|nr:fungal specific transcription factor domain-containing protein [Sarocladium implicatum]
MPTEFAFINNDNPDKIKDPRTRRTVRRHVMKDIGMARRRTGVVRSKPGSTHSPSPTMPFFVPYLDAWDEKLSDSNVASIYRSLDIVDDGVVRLCRTNLALNFMRQKPLEVSKLNMDSSDSLQVYTRSISFVSQAITSLPRGQTLNESTSDEMLGTIVCLAFFDMQNHNLRQWQLHLDGMMKIIQGQGGFTRLESLNELHQSLFWSDVLGCLIFDTMPRIPLPKAIAASHTQRSATPTFGDQAYHIISHRFPRVLDMLVPLRSLAQLSKVAEMPSTPDSKTAGWCKWIPQFANAAHEVLVLPRLRDFQSLTPPPEEQDGQEELREAIRVTTLSFLLLVARNSAYDDMYDARYLRGRVAALMPALELIDWSGIEDLRLWILVISALDERGQAREYLVDQIRQLTGMLGLTGWDQILQRVGEVAWVSRGATCMSSRLEQDVFFDPSLAFQ